MLVPQLLTSAMAKLVLNANKHPKPSQKGAAFTAPFLLLKNALDGPLGHFRHCKISQAANRHFLLVL